VKLPEDYALEQQSVFSKYRRSLLMYDTGQGGREIAVRDAATRTKSAIGLIQAPSLKGYVCENLMSQYPDVPFDFLSPQAIAKGRGFSKDTDIFVLDMDAISGTGRGKQFDAVRMLLEGKDVNATVHRLPILSVLKFMKFDGFATLTRKDWMVYAYPPDGIMPPTT
jgi:hypothetical protein